MKNYTLKIDSGGKRFAVPGDAAESILAALTAAGITEVEAPCGGRGRCGKCSVTVSGPVRSLDTGYIHTAMRESLPACRYAPAGDCVVSVPKRSGIAVLKGGAEEIEAGGHGLGLAVDIGTTTVAAALYDLAAGTPLGSSGERNTQRGCGADVISRITACGEGKLPALRDAIRGQIRSMAEELCMDAGCSSADVRKVVVAGNTVMEHIFTGLDPGGIGAAPFTPASLFGDHREGLLGMADTYICPCVSGYVGGDITAGLLASGGDTAEELRLYVDIGTNGEMALGDQNGYLTCATAAGPAFEGAEIACGMDGSAGAVDRVRAEDGDVSVHVIGGGKAVGLCGSGLVDAVAALLELGVLDETGRMADREELPAPLAARLFPLENGAKAFRLAGEVYLSARDVRQVQLAKAAIRAGAETLLANRGKRAGDISELVIAGGFGSYMDRYSALRIGLLPPVGPDRIRHAGNAALKGAALGLTERGEKRIAAIAAKCEYLELSSARDFMDRYVECMLF